MDGDEEDPPLYEGAPITKWESLLSVLNFQYRHKSEGTLLSNLLKLIDLHIPDPNVFSKTNYKFYKNFEDLNISLKRHYYCFHCLAPLDNSKAACNCQENPKSSYFICIPLQDQLQALYDRPGFYELLNARFEQKSDRKYSDICNGKIYEELSTDGKVQNNPDNITLGWFADGFRVHKSKNEMWGFYDTINELPYSERMDIKNLLLRAVWFGDKKPNFEYVLEVLYYDMIPLVKGVDFKVYGRNEPVHVKVLTILGTCDSPAKAMVLAMGQHNHKFGCQTCDHPGEPAKGAANVRVYDCNKPFKLRTEEEHKKDVDRLRTIKGPINGIKGFSWMSKIAYKFLRTTVVDPMHCVFLGSVKKTSLLWFHKSKNKYGFSKSAETQELVDQRLLFYKPPSHIQRLPNSIYHLADWKSHEHKCWLFYYALPTLCDIIPENEFEMMKLLVHGITLLWQDKVSEGHIVLAERSLEEYVRRFQAIFGLRHVTSCVHLHLHLGRNARDYGSLPVTSCFAYEHINGLLKNFVTGTNSPHLQVCRTFLAFKSLDTLNAEKLRENGPAAKFVDSIHYKVGRLNRRRIDDNTHIVGLCTLLVNEEMKMYLENNGLTVNKMFEFQRLLKHKFLYTSKQYVRPKRTCNYCVTFKGDNCEEIGVIEYFMRIQDCNCTMLCVCKASHFAVITRCNVTPAFKSPICDEMLFHMFLLTGMEKEVIVVNVERIISVNFAMQVADTRKTFISKVVNTMEFE